MQFTTEEHGIKVGNNFKIAGKVIRFFDELLKTDEEFSTYQYLKEILKKHNLEHTLEYDGEGTMIIKIRSIK